MIPQAKSGLDLLADKIMTSLSPAISDDYAVADSIIIATLMKCLSQDAERAVQTRMADLHAMQDLFEAALAVTKQASLRSKLERYLDRKAALPLDVGALSEVHAHASELLIELHSEVEQLCPQPDASQLNDAIWAYLGAHTQRHQYDLPEV